MINKLIVESIRDANRRGLATIDTFNPHFEHLKQEKFTNLIKKLVNEELMKAQRYRFIKKINSKVHTTCSYCGHKEIIKKVPKNRTFEKCISCGSVLETRNVKFLSHKESEIKSYIYFENSTIDKNIIVAYDIEVRRVVVGEFEEIKVEDEFRIDCKYYFDNDSPSRMMKRSWNGWEFTKTIFTMTTNNFKTIYKESVKKALNKSANYKYLPIDLISLCDPLKLIDLYNKHPNIEKLCKIGLENLISEKVDGSRTHNTINWRGQTVYKMLKLDRVEMKFFIEKTNKSYAALKLLQELKKINLNRETEFESLYYLAHALPYKASINTLFEIDKPSRIYSYLSAQREKNRKRYYGLESTLRDFLDMINDMNTLKMKVGKKTIYPKDLDKRHQDIANMIVLRDNKENDKKIKQRVKALKPYKIEESGYSIYPASSVDEILLESQQLGHCVKNYIQRYAEGKTYIFLMRKQEDAEKSMYTIEVSPDLKVRQCRGKHNFEIKRDDEEANRALSVFEKKLKKKTRRIEHEQRVAN